MTFAVTAIFMSFAACALIGWVFTHAIGAVAKKVRGRATSATHRSSDPMMALQEVTLEEIVQEELLAATPLPRGDVETYFENGRWKNKVQGNSRASNVHESWAAAVKIGREMAHKRRVEHIIRKKPKTAAVRSEDPQSVPM
jgi:hypothetical protein